MKNQLKTAIQNIVFYFSY